MMYGCGFEATVGELASAAEISEPSSEEDSLSSFFFLSFFAFGGGVGIGIGGACFFFLFAVHYFLYFFVLLSLHST